MAQAKEQKQGWSGRTDSVMVPQLGADFWKVGTSISGTLESWRETSFTDKETKQTRTGRAYKLALKNPVTIKGELEHLIELPSLAGIQAAIKDLKAKGYEGQKGDVWEITCTDVRPAKREGFSDMFEFSIDVIRP